MAFISSAITRSSAGRNVGSSARAAVSCSTHLGASKPGRFFKVTPDQIQAIRTMASAGQKIARIARITGLSRPTVYRVLEHQDITSAEA